MVATDSNGCEVEAVINNVIAGLSQFPVPSSQLVIFPNPVVEKLFVRDNQLSRGTGQVSVYNMLGERIDLVVDPVLSTVDCRQLLPGIYWLEISSPEKTYRTKFIKQ